MSIYMFVELSFYLSIYPINLSLSLYIYIYLSINLGEVGHSLYTKGNLLLCKRDYLRLFGSTGYCAACNKVMGIIIQ